MSDENTLISKYPYLGYSQNIIEYFSIIGYEEAMLPQIIEEYKTNNNHNDLYSPSIISSIISNKDFGLIDNELIINQIFPYNPKIINVKNNLRNSSSKNTIIENPISKNVIYSFMIDSPDGKTKLFYTCFGYIFYEKYKYYDSNNNLFSLEEYYIPKAFCILSQYSYFSFFYYICNNLHRLLNNKEQQIPLEIIIYNIVNILPAPLNYNFNYNIFSYELEVPSYNIPQLSGYPYLDFNLMEIFNILPLNLVIEIFLITFIEQSILFFSSDLEILNMVMFIMYSLNYPLNNSTYFWHITSIPKSELNEENRFVSQIMTSLLGVYSSYDETIDTFPFGSYHFIVDLDNKKMFFKESNNIDINTKKEVDKLSKLKTYLQNIIKEKSINNSIFLKKFIDQLKKDLNNILSKEEQINQKNKKEINFFNGQNDNNKLIQECFYNFIINILMIFYQNINLSITFERIKIERLKKRQSNEDDEDKLSEEEELFCKIFKTTSKYKIYFENFIQNSESHELYKIPLILSEEFINLKMKSNQKNIPLNISFFNIINNLYSTNQGNNILNLSLNIFYHQYMEDQNKLFFNQNKEINNQNNDNINNNDLQLFSFNKKIIHQYVYIFYNKYEKIKLKEMFPSLKIKKESIYLIDRKILVQTIQNSLEKNNLLKTPNYLFYSLIYIFSILMSLYSYKNLLYYIDKILTCIKKIDFFLRFYIIIIIQTFYKYYLINKEKGDYPEMKYNNIKIYFYLLISHLKDEKILPNEELFLIQKKFFGKNLSKERASVRQKNYNLEMELVDYIHEGIDLDLKNKNVFQIFMKYTFCSKFFYKPKMIIKSAMKETGHYNIAIKDELNKTGKKKTPIIVIKVNENVYTSELYSPKKIFKLSQIVYKDFINNTNLDLENVNIKLLRELLVNLIQYSIELNELNIPYDFLVNGLYLTRNLVEKPVKIKNSMIKNYTIK